MTIDTESLLRTYRVTRSQLEDLLRLTDNASLTRSEEDNALLLRLACEEIHNGKDFESVHQWLAITLLAIEKGEHQKQQEKSDASVQN